MPLRPARQAVTLSAAVILLALSIWIIVPAPVLALLPLGVGAPELSAWLLVLAVILAGAACVDLRYGGTSRLALVLTLIAVALAAIPLVRAAAAIPRLDAAMRDGLGPAYLDHIPSQLRAGMRPSPIVVADLFRGVQTPPPRTTASIVFGTPEGAPLRIDVYAPLSAGPHPALVQIYGGGWQRGDPRDNAAFAVYFAARGYVVFAIDYRHAPRWQWRAQLEDVRGALSWIRSHGAEHGADVNRLAILGRSAGAHLAMLAAFSPGAPPIRAVVSLYGPTDLTRGFREPPRPDPLDVQSVLRAFIGGTPDDRAADYLAASPLTHATRRLPPTLLIYGGRDHVVPPSFGASLDHQLRATGTASVFLVFPWAEHAFDAVPFGPGGQLTLYYVERFLGSSM